MCVRMALIMEAVIFSIQKFSIHDGPGIRTTVFFKGCNLHCAWCCNPESLLPGIQPAYDPEKCVGCGECVKACPSSAIKMGDDGKICIDYKVCKGSSLCGEACAHGALWSYGTKYTVDSLLPELLKDKAFYENSGGGVTLSGGEFLLQTDFAAELCDRLHAEGIHVAAETAAAVPEKIVDKVIDKIDLWQIDLKHYDSALHKSATGTGNEQIINNIKRISEVADCVIRIPVIPDYNDSLEDARRFSSLLKELNIKAVQLMPFHSFGERKYDYLGMKYQFSGAGQLHKEDLTEYAGAFNSNNIKTQIGG